MMLFVQVYRYRCFRQFIDSQLSKVMIQLSNFFCQEINFKSILCVQTLLQFPNSIQKLIIKSYKFTQKEEIYQKHYKTNQLSINICHRNYKKMLQIRQLQQKKSKDLFESSQKDYIEYLKSLLPQELREEPNRFNQENNGYDNNCYSTLNFFNSRSMRNTRSTPTLVKSRVTVVEGKRNVSVLGEFFLKLVKTIAKQRYVQEYGPYDAIIKELGIDIKQLNKIDSSQGKIDFMLGCIDRQIQQHQKKVLYGSKSSNPQPSPCQKPCSFAISISNLSKQNTFPPTQPQQKLPSKYQSFLRQQTKKQADNFAWLQIKTKYPMLQKKLKSKLIQSINQTTNEKRIRQLIEQKEQCKRQASSSVINNFILNTESSSHSHPSSSFNDIEDEKIDLVNESLFMEEFQKAKIDYTWTQTDQKMFLKNIKQLRAKCANNSEFLKLCGRFKFISQKQFQTLASQQISRMLNQNNKIYLSREFLLDKYFSTTQMLTQHQMRFILKTSPMLSKCVDRNFVKMAIKNIKYENISDLELKIAEDIIGRFEKLRNSVRASRKAYKQQINQTTKQRIALYEKNMQMSIAREMAQQQLKHHKVHLMRSLNYQKPTSPCGLSKKTTKNLWTPLNKHHPSTGLFVKDCNEQCTDDIFNPYQKQYLKQIKQVKQAPKRNVQTRAEMIRFYTGGPDQSVVTNFNVGEQDVRNICDIVKAYFFQKKILAALASIELVQQPTTRREESRTPAEIRTKKTLGNILDDDFEMMAKKKLIQNREKAKQSVYVNKLLFLAAQNAFQSLKALNPQFTPQQINTKDKKGNTALYYAVKFNNQDFVDFLTKFGCDPNTKCQKDNTPLHLAFKTNNLSLILKLLTLIPAPNLNCLNSEFKTPLAYCSREILKRLNLEEGVASVDPNSSLKGFDNNGLLQKEQFDKIKEETLEVVGEFAKRVKQNKVVRKGNQTITSIQDMNVE